MITKKNVLILIVINFDKRNKYGLLILTQN